MASSGGGKKKKVVKFDDYALFSIVFFLSLFAVTGNMRLSITLVSLFDLLIYSIDDGMLVRGYYKGKPLVVIIRIRLWELLSRTREVNPDNLYDLFMGYDEKTGKPIMYNLQRLQSMLVAGSTGFGKSTWIQETIDFFTRTHDPDDLRLIICDSKIVSTSPWRNAPHLLLPIAHTDHEHELALRYTIKEMERRQALFAVYEDDFCESLDDYIALSGNRLPRIVIIVDEVMDSVKPKSDAYELLVRIANVARYVGITLLLGTQRPSANVITGRLLNSMVTKVYGYMPNTREYSLVSMIPPEIYSGASATPGRFMLYAVGKWQMMSVKRTSRKAMANRAKVLSGRFPHRRYIVPKWTDLENDSDADVKSVLADRREWRGSLDDKALMVATWFGALDDGRKAPKLKEIMDRYGVSKPTAIKVRNAAFPDRSG